VQEEDPAIDVLLELHVLQFANLERPSVPENLPAGYRLQEEISVAVNASDHVPLGHGIQVFALNAPDTFEYVPAWHSTHVSGVFGPGSLA